MRKFLGFFLVVAFLSLLAASLYPVFRNNCVRAGPYPPFSVTIQAWDIEGWVSEPITMDGNDTGFNTPHTFTGLTEEHTFTVPSTDVNGYLFYNWTNPLWVQGAAWWEQAIPIDSAGTYIAQYYGPYSATILAWDSVNGWLNMPIYTNLATGVSTPHTFTGLGGEHLFGVDTYDPMGSSFVNWSDGDPDKTLPVFSGGTYVAQYYPPYNVTIWAWDSAHGWLNEPISEAKVYLGQPMEPTGFSTPYTFQCLESKNYAFSVPDTDSFGNPFANWTTGETSNGTPVSSGGTYTAQYYETYNATIWAWENVSGWLAEPIQMDGAPSGYSTPHNFTGLTGTHTFTVPSTDIHGYPFENWTTGETSTTITVSADGTYTAQYYVTTPIPEFPVPLFLTVFMLVTLSAALCVRRARHLRLSRASRTRPSPT